MESIRFIGPALVKKYLKYPELISAVKRALQEYSANRAAQPLRISMPVGDKNGVFLAMPSYSKSDETLMTKLISINYDNPQRNLPSFNCYIMVFDPDTGILNSLMDGEVISGMRTAAASVVATQVVAKLPPKTLGILGSGRQARNHIIAFCETFDVEKVMVWNRTPENAHKMCNDLNHLPLHVCATVEEAVKDADCVITTTNPTEPILCGKWLKPGCHVNCVGACYSNKRECDDDCLKNSVIYVDSKESALNESGDIIMSKAEIYAEIGEVLLNEKEVKTGQRTFYKSLGIALQDAVSVRLVWDAIKKEEQPQE